MSAVMATSHQAWIRWDWVAHHVGLIRHQLWEHIVLTVLAVAIGMAIALLMAALAWAWRPLTGPLLALCGVLYAIPSIALFALLVPVTGFTTTTAEIGLVGYTLLILLRNLLVGLESVPAEVRDAAVGMGFGRFRLLLRVELPLALPAAFAGLRIATVTTIGLVTVASLIGQGGLGYLIFHGFQIDLRTEEVLGAALAVALAIAADLLLAGCQRLATPWSQRSARR